VTGNALFGGLTAVNWTNVYLYDI